jgi:biotin transport system substrate-specific component
MNIKSMAQAALAAALIAVCAQITIPFTIPFALQTFAVALALFILGGKLGTVANAVYLVLGACGLPVFSGFRGGVGHILGATGGFIFGFLLFSLLFWALSAIKGSEKYSFLFAVCGLLVCYLCGALWYGLVFGGEKPLALILPFVIPDLLKILLARFIATRVLRSLKHDISDTVGR